MMILKTIGLSKSYGKLIALNNLSIQVEKGSIYGLLGPNGSGKTTTLSILLDVIPANDGTYEWFGDPPSHKSRKKIGSLLETPNFYPYLSAERNLKIAAEIKQVPNSDIERVLKIADLYDRRKSSFKTFSLGMCQRLSIASALLGNPEVLLLDEPTNGLDPQGISDTRSLIRKVAQEGVTIIMASHLLDEVEKVCTDVAILKEGNLLVEGKVDNILGEENRIEVQSENLDILYYTLLNYPTKLEVEKKEASVIVSLPKDISNGDINAFLFEKGITLTHLSSKKKNLEMQFLEITKK